MNDRVVAEVVLLLEWLIVLSLVATLLGRSQAFSSPAFVLLAIGCRVVGTLGLTTQAIRLKGITSSASLVSTLLTAAVAVNLAASARPGEADYWTPIVVQIAGMAAFAAGLRLNWRVALPLQVGTGVLNAIILGSAQASAGPGGLTLGHYLAFAVVPGAAGCGVRLLLEREARDAATALDGALAGQAAAAQRGARLAHRYEHRRALHDTALNTLAAVSRGGLEHVQHSVREQARRDTTLLSQLADMHSGADDELPLEDQVRQIIADVSQTGTRIEVSLNETPELPTHVRRAFAGACREALNNAIRYAGPCAVSVRVSGLWPGVQLRVRDDGYGFSSKVTDYGSGIKESIIGRMDNVGGSATVKSVPECGTEVLLEWHPPGEEDRGSPLEDARRRVGIRINHIALLMTVMYALNAGVSVIGIAVFNSFAVTDGVASAVFFSVAAAVFIRLLRRRTLNAWLSTLLVLHVPVCMLLTGLPLPGCQSMGAEMPFGGCMTGAVIVLALSRPAFDVVAFSTVCAASWLVLALPALQAGESCAVIALTNTVALLTAAVCATWFARGMRRHSQSAVAALTVRARTQAAVRSAEIIAVDRIQLYGVLASTVLPTLRGIGAGELDPRSDSVRTRCASDAVLLRGYLNDALDGHPLVSAIFGLAVEFQGNGERLDIRSIGGDHDVAPETMTLMVDELRRQLVACFRHSSEGLASVTVIDDGITLEISLVSSRRRSPATAPCQPRLVSDKLEVVAEGTDADQCWVRLTHQRLPVDFSPPNMTGVTSRSPFRRGRAMEGRE